MTKDATMMNTNLGTVRNGSGAVTPPEILASLLTCKNTNSVAKSKSQKKRKTTKTDVECEENSKSPGVGDEMKLKLKRAKLASENEGGAELGIVDDGGQDISEINVASFKTDGGESTGRNNFCEIDLQDQKKLKVEQGPDASVNSPASKSNAILDTLDSSSRAQVSSNSSTASTPTVGMSDQSNAERPHILNQLEQKLKKDIESLGGLLLLKEQEWNAILKLKKLKEIALIKVQREQTVNEVSRSTSEKVANFQNLVAWAQQDEHMPSLTGTPSLRPNESDGIDEKGAMESWDDHIHNVIVKTLENYSNEDAYQLQGGNGGKKVQIVGNDLQGRSTCGLKANRSLAQNQFETAPTSQKFTNMIKQFKKAADEKKEEEKAAELEKKQETGRVVKESRGPAFSSTPLKSRPKKKWSPREEIRAKLGKAITKTQNVNGTDQAPTPICENCGLNANYVCAGCSKQWYCSRDCQVDAWDDHSQTCRG